MCWTLLSAVLKGRHNNCRKWKSSCRLCLAKYNRWQNFLAEFGSPEHWFTRCYFCAIYEQSYENWHHGTWQLEGNFGNYPFQLPAPESMIWQAEHGPWSLSGLISNSSPCTHKLCDLEHATSAPWALVSSCTNMAGGFNKVKHGKCFAQYLAHSKHSTNVDFCLLCPSVSVWRPTVSKFL
jgi:hypothetical protein